MANILKKRLFLLLLFVLFFVGAIFASRSPVALEDNSEENFTNSKKRSHISIVGSSTVYPFSAVLAERFGREKDFKTPTVEATGTGGGFKLFCGGIGYDFPDFANASRKIEASEIEKCRENNVNEIGEIKIGYDGIVLANSIKGQKINLSKREIFLALTSQVFEGGKMVNNPYKKFSDINKNLPSINIRVYGPPATSGTRDAFVELIMQDVCMNMEEFVFNFPDKKIRQKKCSVIRSDGVFIEAGENDNLILQKLRNDHDAFGIFGFSFLQENRNEIKAASIDFVEPTFDTIISSKYKVSRPLFIYYKKQHFTLMPEMKDFIKEIVSKNALAPDGYLVTKGLIPLSNLEYKKLVAELRL